MSFPYLNMLWHPGVPLSNAPIRAELFSVERLEQHAESLAAAQHVSSKPRPGRPIARRLYDNTKVLIATYRAVVKATYAQQSITPAAEWLLDNFHVVDEQIREIKNDLPPGFYRKLPKLTDGPLRDYPRVFGIAWALIAHTDSAFDLQKLTRFVNAYQRVQPLTIGELWALAITLRLTLVENLRLLAEAIVTRLSASRLADQLADHILGTDDLPPGPAADVIASLDLVPWSTAFAVQFAQRLRDRDPNTTPALRWLNERLAAERTNIDQIVREEVQQQSAMNVTVRNVITSMRLVSMINWPEFFESVSLVDAVMRRESDFASMDFPTRDLYRRAIEDIAHGADRNEIEIAERATALAKQVKAAAKPGQDVEREGEPGYYLISAGRAFFERDVRSTVPFQTRLLRFHSNLGVMSYVGFIGVATAFILGGAIACVASAGLSGWPLLLLAFVGFVPASDVAVSYVNRLITQKIGATLLPGLELRGGVPPDLATIVVVPILLTNVPNIEKQVEHLEVHFLSNPDDNLCFALLSDWCDSDTEHDAGDDQLLAAAVMGIARLNEQYGPTPRGTRFFLLHRKRVWTPSEGKWIGWERKRGKLHELNRLLRGALDTTFMPLEGRAPSLPSNVRYVITLDADTRLPIGSARRLIGKIAHPLNRARIDPQRGIVGRGHAILQPRVTPSLPIGIEGSLYQRAFSGPNGLDPYALTVSDVYQDLFGEGSYSGKGIYEVDIFETVLKGQIPESTVLSHDLLEGIFGRAGLASDIEVVEEFPSRYSVAAARQHRWVRGDWQLLPWIFWIGRKKDGGRISLPLMGRWKLLDNLRRSLSAPAALLAMLLGWLLPLPVAEIWTAYILLTISFPPLLPAASNLMPHKSERSLRNHFLGLRGDIALGLLQSAFLVTFLAHQAWLMIDAVGRTLFRLFIHRRRLLEWVTAAQANDASRFDRRSLFAQITASATFAGCVAVLMYCVGHRTWPIATPFATLWVLSPLVARWASLPPPAAGHLTITRSDTLALRLVARRTWRFFEKFVTAETNMLPPDNFQESPKPVVANRTSPTNLGLYLLSIASAHDFGWLGASDAVERFEATLSTMDRMERFRGHFFNWYDTTDLRPLEPKYISSVDSGNLAGHLIALGNFCREMAEGPILNARWRSGLEDTLELIRESLQTQIKSPLAADLEIKLKEGVAEFSTALAKTSSAPVDIIRLLTRLSEQAEALRDSVKAHLVASPASEEAEPDLVVWTGALVASIATHRRDIDLLMPWATLIAENEIGHEECFAELLNEAPTLAKLSKYCDVLLQNLTRRREEQTAFEKDKALIGALEKSVSSAQLLSHRLGALSERANVMFRAMEFGFLFDPDRQLLSIGYRSADGSLDSNYYDLLASEARLASFIAIAKGDVPAKHWFRLGRTLTPIEGSSGLISWSGSMFEYLMPSLVMRAPSGSLLEQTNRLVVRRQEQYGDRLGVPWGISESQYNVRDIEQTYQYSSFGVPDLGYKRGLGDDTVIAPYASGLAAMIDPASTARNYLRFTNIGARGHYGWYEALDYTRARLPEGTKVAIIRAYMAHHQAMTIVAIANALHDGQMRARFHAEPIIQSAELLLQERMPRDIAVARRPPELAKAVPHPADLLPEIQRRYKSVHTRAPRTHLLSNGRYSAMVTAVGSGYSRWNDVSLTRWREDVTCDGWGSYIFIRDTRSRAIWSAGYQPTLVEPDSYEVSFFEDRAEIIRHDGSMTTTLDIAVSSEDDAEVRRVTITNHGDETREIEVTSYAEIALARQSDDIAHPVFAKLFVQTEFVPNLGALLATRRRRSAGDPVVWGAHLAVIEAETSGDVQFETDRARFMGRGQTIHAPSAITDGWPLSNTAGAVLDPIFSLRHRVRIAAGATARIAFWTLAAASRDEVLALADKHHDAMAYDRATTLAWTQAQMQLNHLGISTDEAHLFQRLANHVLYSDPTLRPASGIIKRGLKKSSTLWAQGISGDLPIVLVRIEDEGDLELIRQLLRAHEYWRLKQLAVDLVILNERAASYVQDLQNGLDALVRMNQSKPKIASADARGGVFVLRADLVSAEIRELLQASARAVLQGDRGTLSEQINRARAGMPAAQLPKPPKRHIQSAGVAEVMLPKPEMEFFNGLGGFISQGSEYLTVLNGGERTPLPWINVIANPTFGFHVSTEGSGFTWSLNSQQNQVTPWSNDPVSDAPGEVIYVRDDETGDLWGPTALPIRDKNATYSVRHGQGYSRFEHVSHGIALELLQYVPTNDPIKISRLKITNQSGRPRDLSITTYVEWVLGNSRATTASFVATEIDPKTGALFAQNAWNEQFSERIGFLDLNGDQSAWTGDRVEFIGRDGRLDQPLGLTPGTMLSNRVGAGLDPCGVLQTSVKLGAIGTTEIIFFLGEAADRAQAEQLISKYRASDLDAVFNEVTRQWDETLGRVQIKTPDRSLDIMINRWLPYQVLACRVWARAGFYQASGAYGFRDQLQDVMALCIARPDVARAHLLRAAARQFAEGDVQHWWLPESDRGIRTRISDDKIWLGYAVAHYVQVTGDTNVLDEMVAFLDGAVLSVDQHDAFFQPMVSEKEASLFDHCALALDSSLTVGAHGLPLMGTGDWNDGMDRVGEGGQGESVWLGWFLYAALQTFATLAEQHARPEYAVRWRDHAETLKTSLDRHAWDGDWYRRAYFDDGTPLGSVSNSECRIDSIAQSWSIISGAAEPARAKRAMAAVDKYLVRRDDKLSLLFTPPFDAPAHDPGYIKGYPAGIRENGGQYTHGATWAVMAFAMQGDGDKAGELLAMLNPINHADTPNGVHRYKVEPYVVCADIYSVPPHVGRGGWTWYTGSASWLYNVALEWVLGFRLRGTNLIIAPCIPHGWPKFEISFLYHSTRYDILVENPLGVCMGVLATKLDDNMLSDREKALIALVDDGVPHRIHVVLG